ncbi:MAG TPA: ribosomal protein S18-alanine N-acetyltransferase [Candidatus Binatia bacterium]|nr:ribosomal protein S18-alanine N-acetyltransferase [Candidatus Binatia bacterium]
MAHLVRNATLGDVPEMMRLERTCPTAAHWTEQEYRGHFAHQLPTTLALIAETTGAGEVGGFLIARHMPPEWELENVVVAEECRRRGIGAELMQAFLAQAKQLNGATVFLEVRESNTAARALYAKLGFRQSGRRKSYYTTPLEDAVLYTKDLRSGSVSA